MSRPADSGKGNGVSQLIGRVSLLILAALLVFSFTAVQSSASGIWENAVLAGGGLDTDDEEIYTDIVKKAGGGKGNICVVPVSSYPWNWDLEDCLEDLNNLEEAIQCADDYGWRYGNSKINIDYYGQILEEYGIGKYTGVYLDTTIREESSNPELVDAVNTCTGFFFTGGDQSRGIYALRDDKGRPSPVLKAIVRKLRKGALMAGTSAGTAIQTRKYVMANGSNPVALIYGSGPAVYDNTERELVYKEGVCDGCDDLLYNRFKGVGNFKYGITDTHFSDRERTLRLLRLLADTGRKFGFGVDTKTSLSLKNRIMTVMGQDGVTILDLTRARVDKRSKYFGIKGVRISYIRPGDTFDAKRKRIYLGGSPIEEVDTEEIVNLDIMDEAGSDGFQMVSLLSALAKSTNKVAFGYSHSEEPHYRITLRKWWRTRTAIQDGNVSVANVLMTVEALD